MAQYVPYYALVAAPAFYGKPVDFYRPVDFYGKPVDFYGKPIDFYRSTCSHIDDSSNGSLARI